MCDAEAEDPRQRGDRGASDRRGLARPPARPVAPHSHSERERRLLHRARARS